MIETLNIQSIKLTLAEGKSSFPMRKGSFQYDDQITRSQQANPEQVRITEEFPGYKIQVQNVDPQWNRIALTVPVESGEHYYGCGETFSKFDLRGENVRIWVAEHQNSERIDRKLDQLRQGVPETEKPFSEYESYYAQPTFLSSGRYFVHVDTDGYAEFDFRTDGEVTIRMREPADIFVGVAGTYEELSEKLSTLLGRQPELPEWVYSGAILGIQRGPDVIEKKLRKCQEAGVSVAGIWSQDWCGCRRTGFGYQVMWNWEANDSLYPDLQEKISHWRHRGIRFLGYINPFLAIEKGLYREASEKGYCVKNAQGEDYLVTITTFPAAMVDFTNPEAYAWYKAVIKKNLIGTGMSGWMADFGEYLPVDAVLYSGEPAEAVHNRWPAIWARLNREAIEESGCQDDVFFFTRAGSTGTIRYSPMMWNGDQHVDWSQDDGLPSVVPATLSLAVSGFGLCHSDIGGYTTFEGMTRSPELLMRWEEMNAFSVLMRSHEGNQPSRNVQFDEDDRVLRQLARTVRYHRAIEPYLKTLVAEEHSRGLPVCRPLFFYYDESIAYTESYEYLLGRDVLVAPVLQEGEREQSVYLPADRWVHVFTGKRYTGGRYTVPAPIGEPPVFVRCSSPWEELFRSLRDLT